MQQLVGGLNRVVVVVVVVVVGSFGERAEGLPSPPLFVSVLFVLDVFLVLCSF